MRHNHRLCFYLTDLSKKIAEDNSSILGIDFNRYFDRVIGKAMREMIVEVDINQPFKIQNTEHRRPVLPDRYEFIQKLAVKYRTTISKTVEILLIKGLD